MSTTTTYQPAFRIIPAHVSALVREREREHQVNMASKALKKNKNKNEAKPTLQSTAKVLAQTRKTSTQPAPTRKSTIVTGTTSTKAAGPKPVLRPLASRRVNEDGKFVVDEASPLYDPKVTATQVSDNPSPFRIKTARCGIDFAHLIKSGISKRGPAPVGVSASLDFVSKPKGKTSAVPAAAEAGPAGRPAAPAAKKDVARRPRVAGSTDKAREPSRIPVSTARRLRTAAPTAALDRASMVAAPSATPVKFVCVVTPPSPESEEEAWGRKIDIERLRLLKAGFCSDIALSPWVCWAQDQALLLEDAEGRDYHYREPASPGVRLHGPGDDYFS